MRNRKDLFWFMVPERFWSITTGNTGKGGCVYGSRIRRRQMLEAGC